MSHKLLLYSLGSPAGENPFKFSCSFITTPGEIYFVLKNEGKQIYFLSSAITLCNLHTHSTQVHTLMNTKLVVAFLPLHTQHTYWVIISYTMASAFLQETCWRQKGKWHNHIIALLLLIILTISSNRFFFYLCSTLSLNLYSFQTKGGARGKASKCLLVYYKILFATRT